MKFIYSTLATDQDIAVWTQTPDGTPKAVRYIRINGGAQIAKANAGEIYTPLGVRTEISDEDFAFLERDFTFKHFVENGFLTVDDRKINAEKAAGNMELPDSSQGAPLSETELLASAEASDGIVVKVMDDPQAVAPTKRGR